MKTQITYGTRLLGRLPRDFSLFFSQDAGACRQPMGSLEVKYCEIEDLPAFDEIWVESKEQAHVTSRFAVFETSDGFGLSVQCQGRGVFRINRDSIVIEWLPGGTGAAHYFFSYALPLWLESRGVPVLHASAVSLGGVSVAFLGKSGSGKSSLAAMLSQLGCTLIADDGLPLLEKRKGEWQCLSGPSFIKLWPESIEQLQNEEVESLQRVHESFEKRIVRKVGSMALDPADLSLAAIYILERREESSGPVEISSGGDGLVPIRLIEHSLAGGPASVLGLSAGRFERLARLARDVPFKILAYPSGLENSSSVLKALEKDLNVTAVLEQQ